MQYKLQFNRVVVDFRVTISRRIDYFVQYFFKFKPTPVSYYVTFVIPIPICSLLHHLSPLASPPPPPFILTALPSLFLSLDLFASLLPLSIFRPPRLPFAVNFDFFFLLRQQTQGLGDCRTSHCSIASLG